MGLAEALARLRTRAGDEKSLEREVLREIEAISMATLRMNGFQESDAKDIYQTKILKLLKVLIEQEDIAAPESYVRRAAIYAARDYLRQSSHEGRARARVAPPEPVARGISPEVLLEQALATLTPAERELYVAAELRQESREELAEARHVKRNTIDQALRRITLKLRAAVADILDRKDFSSWSS